MENKSDIPNSPATMSEVLKNVQAMGYSKDLNKFLITEKDEHADFDLSEFKIDRSYRFEGISDPSDEAVVYAISSDRYELKGYLIDGYGIYADPEVEALAKKMKKSNSSK